MNLATPIALACTVGLATACGGTPAAEPVQHADSTTQQTTSDTRAPRRQVIAGTTYGGLVRAAGSLTASGSIAHVDNNAPCLLGLDADLGVLGVEPASALGSLPAASEELATRLRRTTGPVRVLTRWGQHGTAAFDLVLATWTPLSPQAMRDPLVALVLTDDGVFVRETDRTERGWDEPMTIDGAMSWLATRASQATVTVVVAAEAGVSAQQVHYVLRAIPRGVNHVALAIALADGTRLPDPTPTTTTSDALCPDGLPELPIDAPEGDMPSASIVRSISAITGALQACLGQTTGPGAMGGRITLALRLADTGRVDRACLAEDNIGDPLLAACIAETARTASFSRPHPAGFVDIHVPLSLSPISDPAPRPVCN